MNKTELKKKRKELEMTQFQLAAKAKVSRFNIAMFETGQGKLRDEEIASIKRALKPSPKKKVKKNAKNH